MTIPHALTDAAARHSSAPLWFHDSRDETPTTVGDLHAAARSVAAGLQSRGIGPGDTVAVQLPNRVEAAVAYQAVLLTGATLVPIVHIYGAHEVEFMLAQSGARMLVMPDQWHSIDYRARLPFAAEVEVIVIGEAPPGTTPWTELYADGYRLPDPAADAVAVLSYTSGTTVGSQGRPAQPRPRHHLHVRHAPAPGHTARRARGRRPARVVE